MKRDPKQRTIVVIDEDADSLELISEPLRWEGYDVHGFTSLETAQTVLSNLKPQLIVVDPDFALVDGADYVSHLITHSQSEHNHSPVMVLSSHANTDQITQYLDMGAVDFITTPFVPLEFLARVRTQFRLRDTQEQLLETNKQLQEMVEIDDLTGLFNTRSLYSKLEFEMDRAGRFNRSVSVVMIDLDKFKSVNDGHDHLFGSFVLSEIGKLIKKNTRTVDIPARYGGDEFLIVLSEIPLSGVQKFCEKLRAKVEASVFSNGTDSIKLTLSIGWANFDSSQEMNLNAKELVRRADVALYEAKKQGRNQVKSYDKSFDRLRKIEKSAVSEIFEKKSKTAA